MRHPDEYIIISEEKGEKRNVSKRQRSKSLCVSIDPNEIREACVEMVTVNGRPLTSIDDSGFRRIIDPILNAAPSSEHVTVTSRTIRDDVTKKAEEIRGSIRDEIKVKIRLYFLRKSISQ